MNLQSYTVSDKIRSIKEDCYSDGWVSPSIPVGDSSCLMTSFISALLCSGRVLGAYRAPRLATWYVVSRGEGIHETWIGPTLHSRYFRTLNGPHFFGSGTRGRRLLEATSVSHVKWKNGQRENCTEHCGALPLDGCQAYNIPGYPRSGATELQDISL